MCSLQDVRCDLIHRYMCTGRVVRLRNMTGFYRFHPKFSLNKKENIC